MINLRPYAPLIVFCLGATMLSACGGSSPSPQSALMPQSLTNQLQVSRAATPLSGFSGCDYPYTVKLTYTGGTLHFPYCTYNVRSHTPPCQKEALR